MEKVEYLLGHSKRELERLQRQAEVGRPFTEHFLSEIGVGPGWKVLEIGCGAGDLAMRLGELVGPSGFVIGVDRSADAIDIARTRTRAVGLEQVSFQQSSAEEFTASMKFDLAIARLVLVHQKDPTTVVRAAAQVVRPGGTVAFYEPDLTRGAFRSSPYVPILHKVADWMGRLFEKELPHHDVGTRLVEQFYRAGLPRPRLISHAPVLTGDDLLRFQWLVDILETLRPKLIREGIITEDEFPSEGLAEQLQAAVLEAHSQVIFPSTFGVWAKII